MKFNMAAINLATFFLLSSTIVQAKHWTMNDVTYLLPLPASIHEANLFAPFSEGQKGRLIPREHIIEAGFLDRKESIEDSLGKLRAVAVRLDPCFKMSGVCVPQIRMIFQPMLKLRTDVKTQDAAVHSFYNLTQLEFDQLMGQIEVLKNSNPQSEMGLTIHPIMLAEGYSGPFAQEFYKIILKYAGQDNLSRVTFMQVNTGGDLWNFFGFDVANDQLLPIQIPRIATKVQGFQVATYNGKHFNMGRVFPEPTGDQDLLGALVKEQVALKDAAGMKKSTMAILRIENPDVHSPETMDCVSCHLTHAAGGVAFSEQPLWLNDPEVAPWRFQGGVLNNSGKKRDVRVMRALGYFDREPITSQRVVNESKAIVDYLNSL
jgi:hypothetical protein